VKNQGFQEMKVVVDFVQTNKENDEILSIYWPNQQVPTNKAIEEFLSIFCQLVKTRKSL